MAQRRFVAKLVLSCACTNCAPLQQRVRGSIYVEKGEESDMMRRTRMAARAPRRVSVALM